MKPFYRSQSSISQDASWLQISESRITADTPFSEAANYWLGSLSGTEDIGLGTLRRVRKNTETGYRQNIDTLKLFFGDLHLGDIRLDHISRYEALRLTGDGPFIRRRRPNKNVEPAPCPAGPKKCNQEIGILKRILRFAKVWGEEQDQCYQPLTEEESDAQRALTPEEQAHWLQVARGSSRWHLVYYYSELAFATCMSTNEIRALRLCDIHLEAGHINIPWGGSKNKYRHRTIEIGCEGDVSWHAVEWLLSRAYKLGAKEPNHYLFPFRPSPADFDPSRPMTVSGIKKLWEEMRIATKLPHFRQYDTRHTAITRYAENGTSIAVIMDMAGHISPKMTRHYTHISERVKLQAMRQVQVQAQTRAAERPKSPRVDQPAQVRVISPAPQPMAPAPQPLLGVGAGGFFFNSSFTIGR
jgi:integrase